MLGLPEFDPLAATRTLESAAAVDSTRGIIRQIVEAHSGWYDPFAELIQNALDAVEEKLARNEPDYLPLMRIIVDLAENSLTVTDNGTGLLESQYRAFLAPGVSFKSSRRRGHKGAGATYLAYGVNQFRVRTRRDDFEAAGRMVYARDWLDGRGSEGRPVLQPDNDEPKDAAFPSQSSGVTITLRFDEHSRPADLSWLKAETAAEWYRVLSLKTRIGSILEIPPVEIHLAVIGKDGEETSLVQPAINRRPPPPVEPPATEPPQAAEPRTETDLFGHAIDLAEPIAEARDIAPPAAAPREPDLFDTPPAPPQPTAEPAKKRAKKEPAQKRTSPPRRKKKKSEPAAAPEAVKPAAESAPAIPPEPPAEPAKVETLKEPAQLEPPEEELAPMKQIEAPASVVVIKEDRIVETVPVIAEPEKEPAPTELPEEPKPALIESAPAPPEQPKPEPAREEVPAPPDSKPAEKPEPEDERLRAFLGDRKVTPAMRRFLTCLLETNSGASSINIPSSHDDLAAAIVLPEPGGQRDETQTAEVHVFFEGRTAIEEWTATAQADPDAAPREKILSGLDIEKVRLIGEMTVHVIIRNTVENNQASVGVFDFRGAEPRVHFSALPVQEPVAKGA